MKVFSLTGDPGVICSQENNRDLFIRKTVFPKGYSEKSFHTHPNSFEFYLILAGKLTFKNESDEIQVSKNQFIYFEEAEPYLIIKVDEDVEMLLIKKIGVIKE